MNNIKNSNQNSFSVRLAYDEETGLINHVYITVQKQLSIEVLEIVLLFYLYIKKEDVFYDVKIEKITV